ncbi:MAG: hypothetical protein AB1505_10850 [Candidatus Latescibacterota bacterium]
MDTLSREGLQQLMAQEGEVCISLYMPAYRVEAEVHQNPIRLKNLTKRVQEELEERGQRNSVGQVFTEQARRLLADEAFWLRQGDGLALFCCDAFFRALRLPLRLEEQVVIGPRFYVKPLLPLLTQDGRFCVLALSRNQVRLLRCTRYSVQEVELQDTPRSLEEALRYDEAPQRLFTMHAAERVGAGGDRVAVAHGHGGGTEDEQEKIVRFLRQVDRGVQRAVNGSREPLVLAGVDALLGLYRTATAYGALVPGGVEGSADRKGAEQLRDEAWEVVAPLFQARIREARERCEERLGTGLASSQLLEVVPASFQGRVDTLLVAVDRQAWGSFDPRTQQVKEGPDSGHPREELLNLAATHALLNRGTVHAVPADQIPRQAPLAALFRY